MLFIRAQQRFCLCPSFRFSCTSVYPTVMRIGTSMMESSMVRANVGFTWSGRVSTKSWLPFPNISFSEIPDSMPTGARSSVHRELGDISRNCKIHWLETHHACTFGRITNFWIHKKTVFESKSGMEQMLELFKGFVPIKTVGIDVLQPTCTTNPASS